MSSVVSAAPFVGALAAGAVAGLASVPHCMGMCGPLVVGVCKGPRQGLSYQLGRTLSYTLLGAAAGQALLLSTGRLPAHVASLILSGGLALGLLFAAARLLRSLWRTRTPTEQAERTTAEDPDALVQLSTKPEPDASRGTRPALWKARASAAWAAVARPLLRSPSLVGLLSALLPCGALLNLLLLAGATGHPLAGALTGTAFALTTGLGLATSLWAGSILRESRAGSWVMAGVLVVGAGIVAFRALPAMHALQDGSEALASPECHAPQASLEVTP